MNKKDKRFNFSVGELIEILKEFPPEMPVVTSGYKNGYENFYLPETRIVKHEPENSYQSGEFQITGESDKDAIEVLAFEREMRDD